MKELGRSVHSVDVIKKKSSSGCLIIKKKVTDGVGGVKGFSDSSSRNLFNSTKEKKRPRAIRSDSESSDEFTERNHRKIGKFLNVSVYSNAGFIENRESDTYKRVNKYEFDGFHERMNMKNVNDYKHRFNSHLQNRDQYDYGIGSGTNFGANNSRFTHEINNHYNMDDDDDDDDESNLPDEPIRLQGKNGVLKVMVKKHKQLNVPHQSYNKPEEWKKEHRPEVYIKKQPNVSYKNHDFWEKPNKKKTVIDSSLYSGPNHSGKPVFSKKSEPELTDDDSDSSLPVKSSSLRNCVTENTVKIDKKQTKNAVIPVTVKGKESKVKRGSGTEKQLLREKIRSMLLKAGWNIDYRPRKNRDYLDAVYINPSGTAYWSIIKAYEALQKEEKDHLQIGGEFTPLPLETLSKLTRQTRKKIEREMKKKIKNDFLGADLNIVHARKSNNFGRCALLIRSDGKTSENDDFVPYSGKRTLLSWLIDSKTVQIGEKVEYMNRKKTRVMQEGWITKEGIQCGCCSKILTVLKFEVHAGSKIQQPFLNIFAESGKCLMQVMIDSWNKQGEIERNGYFGVGVDVNGDDPNDDTCGLCGDGGDLICCDSCPSTFHQICLGIQMVPQGDWHCPNCSCKYCEMVSTSAESQLLVCSLCEKKYHESCSMDLDEKPIDLNLSFCGHKCLHVYKQLQKLIGVKHEIDSGLSWSIIHRSDISSSDSDYNNNNNIIISPIELSERVECNSKLAVALSVIDECFMPLVDRRSRINLIHNVVYNCRSNLSRLNYSGFYTVFLERNDELISAASIRIHGTQLAEMPFIGTRHMYRRQGMCRRLLSAIESVLSSLKIEKLIIPAIAEHMHTWTDVFGFNPLEESHKQELKSINMLVVPGTNMLQKQLLSENGQPAQMGPNSSSSFHDGHTDSDSQHRSNLLLENSDSIGAKSQQFDSIEAKSQHFDSIDANSQHFDSVDAKSQQFDSIDAKSQLFDSIEPKSQHFDSVPPKTGAQDGNEITDKIDNADSKVENDTETAENPKESVSSDAKCDLKVEEFVIKTAEKESDSVSADLDSKIQVTDVQIADVIPLESRDSISTREEK